LPDWVVAEAHLPPDSTIASLGPEFWTHTNHTSTRLLHYVTFLIHSRAHKIGDIKVFDRPWPSGLAIDAVALSTRSRNALEDAGLIDHYRSIAGLTFKDLAKVPRLGVKSILEITTVIEAAMGLHDRLTASLSPVTPIAEPTPQIPPAPEASSASALLLETLRRPWVDQLSGRDPRFAAFLPVAWGTLEERIEYCLADPNSAAADAATLVRNIDAISALTQKIEAQYLEDALADLLSALMRTRAGPSDAKRLEAMAMRFGWNGNAPSTLQECGDFAGITRERLRQIESKIVKRLPRHPVYMPKLDLAIEILEAAAPRSASEAAYLLQRKGVSRNSFSPAALIETARLLGRETTLAIQTVRGQQLVVAGSNVDGVGTILRIARALSGSAGVASVFQVVDRLAAKNQLQKDLEVEPSKSREPITEDDVRRLLQRAEACEFLDEDWFWFSDIPEKRNRLCNVTMRILSVASPQTISSVREGIRRAFGYRAKSSDRYRSLTVPPVGVLKAFYRQHPDFTLIDEMVGTVRPLDYREHLGSTEQVLVEVFRSAPAGVMDRKSMTQACSERGLNENTLSVYSTYSPIVEHVGVDIWKLRGVRVDPAAVEALREQNELRPRETRLLEYGWTPEGRLWVAWRLPAVQSSIVLGIPGATRRYLSDRTFAAVAKETGRAYGNVSVNAQGSSYGYSPFLRSAGADEGDVLLAEFDISANMVHLDIGDENLLEVD
jgi:hypothetical protein